MLMPSWRFFLHNFVFHCYLLSWSHDTNFKTVAMSYPLYTVLSLETSEKWCENGFYEASMLILTFGEEFGFVFFLKFQLAVPGRDGFASNSLLKITKINSDKSALSHLPVWLAKLAASKLFILPGFPLPSLRLFLPPNRHFYSFCSHLEAPYIIVVGDGKTFLP